MQRLIMDMPLMISVARWHAADRHGKTEEVALAIERNIHRCNHANAHAGNGQRLAACGCTAWFIQTNTLCFTRRSRWVGSM